MAPRRKTASRAIVLTRAVTVAVVAALTMGYYLLPVIATAVAVISGMLRARATRRRQSVLTGAPEDGPPG